jgi:hypothetical protein
VEVVVGEVVEVVVGEVVEEAVDVVVEAVLCTSDAAAEPDEEEVV